MSNIPKAREELHKMDDHLDRAKRTKGTAEAIRDICEMYLYRKKPSKKKKGKR